MKLSKLIVNHSQNTHRTFHFFFSILLISIISTSIGFAQCNSDDDCENGFACIPPEGDCNFETGGGECVDTNVVWWCFAIWDPVCGCDGATYGNACEANNGGFTGVDYLGVCNPNPPECTDNDNCDDCYDDGCFWQPVAPEGYQCNTECLIMDTDCYGQAPNWTAECPEDDIVDCCSEAELANENCGGAVGCYIPQCTANCEWEPMQCWSSTGYCWCVDEYGDEIDGTSQPVWQGYPDCEEEGNQIGDECVLANGETGFYDCEFNCMEANYYYIWLGDGFCDEGWGVNFNCPEFGYDCSDCNVNWDGTDPLGFCEESCSTGDLTEDGAVNVLDVVAMVEIILSVVDPNDPWGFWLCAGDMNGDGNINVLDVIEMVNIILNPMSDDCYIIPEIGPCDGICPTYYYNQDNNQCVEFITGCCGVEAFDSEQSCEEICE